MNNQELIVSSTNICGRLTLNRPQVLNALSYPMISQIEKALEDWQENNSIKTIMIDATGTKAFCAGGDVQQLYHAGLTGNLEFGRNFWRDEYRLNAKIANYPKPFVALMDGIVMGGGVGVSAHSSHRIVTENTMLAMPECAIGLVPDIGGTYLLARAPYGVGKFMAATGARLSAADAIYAGFADIFVPADHRKQLTRAIEDGEQPEKVITNNAEATGSGTLEAEQDLIREFFDVETASVTVKKLEASSLDWAKTQLDRINKANPLAVACAYELIDMIGKNDTVENALQNEFRFSFHSQEYGDLSEGIRARIIDKDNTPDWKIKSIASVKPEHIAFMLASLGENELDLKLEGHDSNG